jgi:hypothetical protein
MSEKEQFELQGRTYAELKATKTEIAAVKANLRDLQIRLFASATDLDHTDDVTNTERLKTMSTRLMMIDSSEALKWLATLAVATARCNYLQAQVDQF